MGGPFRTNSPYEIVGVVKDARYFTMRGGAEPTMFVPVWRRFVGQTEVLIRTSGPTPQLASEVRREIQKLNPVVPLLNLRTLEHDVDENILVERLVATLSGLFGFLAVLLSALGMYGVIAYTVTRRTREIGIRIAIGAERASVLWLVLEDALFMVLVGGVIGAFGALLATRAIASILYGVSANDPTSIAAAGLCLTVAAIVASFLPARRASKIQPSAALRYE
jgi:ABC-type antimicrobial peptide transport system permease subunit